MEILAKRGDGTFLVTDGEGEPTTENPTVRIVSLDKQLSYVIPLQQALKWGYWEEPGTIPAEVHKVIDEIYPVVAYDYTQNELGGAAKEAAKPRPSESYIVKEGTKTVGTITFGSVPAAEITSQNEKLLKVFTSALVNPVTVVDGDGGTIYASVGDPSFPDAVIQLIKNEGFTVTPK